MGSHNIFSILHNDNVVQHSKIIFKNNPRPIFLRWLECPTLSDNPYDENAGVKNYWILGLVLINGIF